MTFSTSATNSAKGILTTLPPAITPSAYPVFVPKTDADGNDVAGIRLPEIEVPIATYSGWNIRSADYAADDMCNASGQKIPFPATMSDRVASGDPRPSVQERYRNHAGYVARVTVAATNLANESAVAARGCRCATSRQAVISPVGR